MFSFVCHFYEMYQFIFLKKQSFCISFFNRLILFARNCYKKKREYKENGEKNKNLHFYRLVRNVVLYIISSKGESSGDDNIKPKKKKKTVTSIRMPLWMKPYSKITSQTLPAILLILHCCNITFTIKAKGTRNAPWSHWYGTRKIVSYRRCCCCQSIPFASIESVCSATHDYLHVYWNGDTKNNNVSTREERILSCTSAKFKPFILANWCSTFVSVFPFLFFAVISIYLLLPFSA